MDGGGRDVEEQAAKGRGRCMLAAAAEWVRRVGAVGHLGSRLAGRKRAGALPGADDRRCDQLELGAVRGAAMRRAQNMGVLWEYLEKNGRMVDVYTDRDSMFTVPPRPGRAKRQRREADRLTQIGAGLTGTGNRFHSGVLAASQGAR